MLPIVNLNGYKIANPSVLARIPEEELLDLFRGHGYSPRLVSGGFDGEDPMLVHARFAAELGRALDDIAGIQREARVGGGRCRRLAGARAAHAQGLDGTEGRGRAAGGRDLALAPGAAGGSAGEAGSPRAIAGVDAELPAGRNSSTGTA